MAEEPDAPHSDEAETAKTMNGTASPDDRPAATETGIPGKAASGGDSYSGFVRIFLRGPDHVMAGGTTITTRHAMTSLGIFFASLYFAVLAERITGYDGLGFRGGYLGAAFVNVLVLLLPLLAVPFLLSVADSRTLPMTARIRDWSARLFTGLLLPALLLVIAGIVDLLGAGLHIWLRGLTMALIYTLVFSLAAVATDRHRAWSGMGVLSIFYLFYRLLAWWL